MSDISCGNCRQPMSRKAPTCPQCGHPNAKAKHLSPTEILVGLLAAGAVLYFLASGSSSPPASVPASSASASEEAACRQDLRCWGEKHHVAAARVCQPLIERMAKYDLQWTDAWHEPKMSRFAWKDKDAGIIVFLGDKVKFQNGFGAWQQVTYHCDYNTLTGEALDVRLYEGRL